MPMRLLPVNHLQQDNEFGCLAACTQMVLRFYDVTVSQTELNRLFELRSGGVPFSNVSRVARYRVRVTLEEGNEYFLKQAIDQQHPLIIFVHTEQLTSYWDISTWHAVVVVGYDEDNFLIHDPAFHDVPKRVAIDELMLAWLEFDYSCALITR